MIGWLQTDLGDRLLAAFNHQSQVPFSDVNLHTRRAHAPRWGPDSSTSEVTTIQLEFNDLSEATGDDKYRVSAGCGLSLCLIRRLKQLFYAQTINVSCIDGVYNG